MTDKEKWINKNKEYADQFEYLTIEPASQPCAPGEVAVKGYKKCKKGVMKGQMIAHFIETFSSSESAKEAYPYHLGDAEPGPSGHQNTFHHLPDDQEPGAGQRMNSQGLYE